MQPVDFTTLMASCCELQQMLLPARLEQVYQRDRWTICLALRTLEGRRWLSISWHRQAARIGIEDAPPKQPDTFTFSQQLWHQLGGLALVEIVIVSPWERLVELRFAKRPGDPIAGHIYVEIMGQYSNAVLVSQEGLIITAAHQVSERQSRLRPIQTGARYELPPTLIADIPSLEESLTNWQEKIRLIPGKLRKNLTSLYRGLSSSLVKSMLQCSQIDWDISTDELNPQQWQQLFKVWQFWLKTIESETFSPHWTDTGYTVIDWASFPQISSNNQKNVTSLQVILKEYYSDRLAEQIFQQLRHQLQQRLQYLLKRLKGKRQGFLDRLDDSEKTAQVKQQADLLMAHLQQWQPGMRTIEIIDFESHEPVTISLSPDKNAVQNAQALYKKHQKLKRSRGAITPLLNAVQSEVDYLEQVTIAIAQLETGQTQIDLTTLEEIRDELVTAGYVVASEYQRPRRTIDSATQPHRFSSPSGYEILVGRNNRQNDQLTFRTATDYDLWFHTQQIHGSHVLLRLDAGSQPSDADLQHAADLATYFSQARDSEQAPIVYTAPKHVYKPKGANLGMVIYKHETVIWGKPQRAKQLINPARDSQSAATAN
ncbi:NFACT family protein [filamentous cyanobacterium LEGE 11480]|uniref:Rqc2 homolog RqcH n=1 Tax=Romeriopsis navalis LEGE 11480 TaxID=2777977 RepID=A0A928Z271_9CYAN|nr:NFACT family protein [Romeriopsis navalis]MBE9029239.1 NFACT family protein [Romeriopsis navalis LEGE 11480]